MAKKIYRMNIDLAGFKKGRSWVEGTEPEIVTKWAELGGGVFVESAIITIEDYDGDDTIETGDVLFKPCPRCGYFHGIQDELKAEKESVQEESDIDSSSTPAYEPEFLKKEEVSIVTNEPEVDETETDDTGSLDIRKCKGTNQNGSPCSFTGKKVKENGYCGKHQHQVPKSTEAGES